LFRWESKGSSRVGGGNTKGIVRKKSGAGCWFDWENGVGWGREEPRLFYRLPSAIHARKANQEANQHELTHKRHQNLRKNLTEPTAW